MRRVCGYLGRYIMPALLTISATQAFAQSGTKLRLVLNFAADGGAAGFYHAKEKGYYKDLGLEVEIEPSKGSGDAISRAAAGSADIAIGDVATLIEFTARRPEQAPKAVFLLYNRSPQALITFKSSGITKVSDLAGRVLGQGAADASARMFPALAKNVGLDMSKIDVKQFSPQIRDTMLVTKQVDAIIGFDSTVLFNLKANGVKLDDLTVVYYSDNGLNVYGNAILANPQFLHANTEAVKAFVRASVRGWREAMADPKAAMESLGKNNSLANLELEAERLLWLGSHHILTEVAKKEGIGAYDPARLKENIAQVTASFELPRAPEVAEIYDDRFTPPQDERMPLK
jgi:NitT/TauT family transport system substrate-binding protein